MPELPEVETIRRDLDTLLRGKTIAGVDVLDRRTLEGFGPQGAVRRRVSPAAFAEKVVGRTVRAVERRGKYLLLRTDPEGVLVIHLRMTGQLIWGPPRPDARARLSWTGESAVLNYCDTRRFGEWRWWAHEREDPGLARLGPDPLVPGWDTAAWAAGLRRSKGRVHSLLLDQRRLAGVGNIYATEALFHAGIRPTRRGCRVSVSETGPLLAAVRRVLEEGLRYRGVSFRDYRDARGERGEAQDRLAVYGRQGAPCRRCGAVLAGAKVAGRGTVYCPRCQR